MKLQAIKVASPVGELTLVSDQKNLRAILWENDKPNRVKIEFEIVKNRHPILEETRRQLQEYFAGDRNTFDLPLYFDGTEFQKKVWKSLLRIPFGETRSYGDLAKAIGLPKASRAVGTANGRNPISIVVPCHRVLGSNGSLTGFAGGLSTKSKLQKLECKERSWS